MPKKQTMWSRFKDIGRAKANQQLDKAEDPEAMLELMVVDYRNNIIGADKAIAQTIGNQRQLEEEHRRDVAAAMEWGGKAQAAAKKANELEAAGNPEDAQKFKELARVALSKQISFEQEAKDAAPLIANGAATVEKLKKRSIDMKAKLGQLQSQKDQLIARSNMADAQDKVQEAIGAVDIMDPTSTLGRYSKKIESKEARVQGMGELQEANDIESQFAALEGAGGGNAEVEARLAELMPSIEAPKKAEELA